MLPRLEDIKVRRLRLGWTQKELARESGVSQSAIAKIERGRMVPSYQIITRLIETLDKAASESTEEKRVGEVMVKDVMILQADARIEEARKAMKSHGISQIPVMDNGVAVGTITERSILAFLDMGGRSLSEGYVREALVDELPQLPVGSPVRSARELLRNHPAILVTEHGQICGIVTRADLIYNMGD